MSRYLLGWLVGNVSGAFLFQSFTLWRGDYYRHRASAGRTAPTQTGDTADG